MSIPDPKPAAGGVIHDLGYRGYAGERTGRWGIAMALFLSGLAALFGFGRPGKAKIRPLALLAVCLTPAVVMVGVLVLVRVRELPLSYAGFPAALQLLVSLFAATQAPLILSADQRSGVVALYFARPTGPVLYALARLASLWCALLIFLWLPMLLLYAGALLAELGAGEQTRQLLSAMALSALLGLAISGLAGALAAFSVRRGFAVLSIIGVLLVLDTAVAIVADMAGYAGNAAGAQLAALASPYAMYRALADASGSPVGSVDNTWKAVYAIGLLVFAAVGTAATLWRMRKVAGR